MLEGIASCANHPDREALGVCVGCRKLVCAECTTRLDGINHCVACIARMATGDERYPVGTRGVGGRALGALLLYLTAAGATALLFAGILGG